MKKYIFLIVGFLFALNAFAVTWAPANLAKGYTQKDPERLDKVPYIWAMNDTVPCSVDSDYVTLGKQSFCVDLSKLAGGIPQWVSIRVTRGYVSALTGNDTAQGSAADSVAVYAQFGRYDGIGYQFGSSDTATIASAANEVQTAAFSSTVKSVYWSTATGIGDGKFPAYTYLVDSLVTAHVDTGSTNSGYTWNKVYIPKQFNAIRFYFKHVAASHTALSPLRAAKKSVKVHLSIFALPGAPLPGMERPAIFPSVSP